MDREIDKEAAKLAQQLVDKRIPLPNESPGGAAFTAVVMSGIVLVVATVLSSYMGSTQAMAVTATLAGLLAWLDCEVAYKARARLYQQEYDLFAERNERIRVAQAERDEPR